jgi:prenyltransferase beta subunit
MGTIRWRRGPLTYALLVALVALGCAAAPARAAAERRATVVVQFADGTTAARLVRFAEPSISGLEALRRSGLGVVERAGAVCRIAGVGCPAADCFCAAPRYWAYFHRVGGQWQYSTTGAGAHQVADGAVEGWSWGRALPALDAPAAAAQAALPWLRERQNPDGSYGDPASPSRASATIDALLAVRAAAGDVAEWRGSGGASLLDALGPLGARYAATGASAAGKLALALAAADADPRAALRQDLVISLTQSYRPATGAFGESNWDQAFGVLGWRAAGEAVPLTATNLLAASGNGDGGWGYSPGGASDVDSTALVLQALRAGGAPVTSTAVLSGAAYLRAAQNADGGFPYAPAADSSDTSNANSTAFAVQGLLAAGLDPLGVAPTLGGTTPISYLLALQQPDGGIAYLPTTPSSNLLATQQALPALAGRAFPYASRAVGLRKGLAWIATQQQADGSFAGFNPGATLDAVLAIGAAGGDPQAFRSPAGNTPLDYLRAQAADYAARGAAAAGKLAAAVVAAGSDPQAFGGASLPLSLTLRLEPATGSYGASTFDQAWALLGLRAAGASVPLSATANLLARAAPAGGWGFGPGDPPDADSTGLALQALAAAGVPATNAAVQAGLAFLRGAQNGDGGFPGFDGATSASSTGLALGGLAAYGERPRGPAWTTVITDGAESRLALHDPVDALLAQQSPRGGFAGFSGPDDPGATYQALPGLAGGALPTRARALVFLPLVAR